MIEHRSNWKEELGAQARERAAQRQDLLVALDAVRDEIKCVGLDFETYDQLKAQQREIVAALAVL